jgi:hypothetical protein
MIISEGRYYRSLEQGNAHGKSNLTGTRLSRVKTGMEARSKDRVLPVALSNRSHLIW